MIIMLPGCSAPPKKIGFESLHDPDVMTRIQAIRWVADNNHPQAVPELVNMLSDEDQAVRFYAITALKELTGTDLGYDFKAGPAQRAAALKKWKEKLKTDEGSLE